MRVVPTGIDGLTVVEPDIFRDDRGFFLESWSARAFADAGFDVPFVQDNHSRSARGVLRGLHLQHPRAQGKLVRVTRGRIWDVAVDLRRSSSSYGDWRSVELAASTMRMLWVPPGFAHGFLSLEDDTDVLYKCTEPYAPADERTLLWNDPVLGIDWPLHGMVPRLSAKDATGVTLARLWDGA